MGGYYGYQVKDPNFRLRFSLIVIMGLLAFGSILFWRGSVLFAAEYQDLPVTHEQIKIKNSNQKKQKALESKQKSSLEKNILKKYQIEE
jgi:hypothetical protein